MGLQQGAHAHLDRIAPQPAVPWVDVASGLPSESLQKAHMLTVFIVTKLHNQTTAGHGWNCSAYLCRLGLRSWWPSCPLCARSSLLCLSLALALSLSLPESVGPSPHRPLLSSSLESKYLSLLLSRSL